MRVTPNSLLAKTLALENQETCLAAIDAIRDCDEKVAIDGLIDLVYRETAATESIAAIRALADRRLPTVDDALLHACGSSRVTVRAAAATALAERVLARAAPRLETLLKIDPSWLVRRPALEALSRLPGDERWRLLVASSDPHWRVRHALLLVLLQWGGEESRREEILARLDEQTDERTQGVVLFLQQRWDVTSMMSIPNRDDPSAQCRFWDWDAAVLARNIKEQPDDAVLTAAPVLLPHEDEAVRRLAAKALLSHGDAAEISGAINLLAEPRTPAAQTIQNLLTKWDWDRREDVVRHILEMESPSPRQWAWAVDQIGDVIPFDEYSVALTPITRDLDSLPRIVRAACARLASRCSAAVSTPQLIGLLNADCPDVVVESLRAIAERPGTKLEPHRLKELLSSPNEAIRCEAVSVAIRDQAGVTLGATTTDESAAVRLRLAQLLPHVADTQEMRNRLQEDPHPAVRAAALSESRAEELLNRPEQETSWSVLQRACRLTKAPRWEIEPDPPWSPLETQPLPPKMFDLSIPQPAMPRSLGRDGYQVCQLGLSGHYGFPTDGFARAAERGVNLMFWEPNYEMMTSFARRLSPRVRERLHFVAGTFAAEPECIRKDIERALHKLRLERLSLFLLFWTRSWDRITPAVEELLEEMRTAGKIERCSLSTHSRTLAVEAIDRGWNPVMVRHSAVHRKAEDDVFPAAMKQGTGIITFSNTCYGRLIQPTPISRLKDAPRINAADCYRYTLSQPAVSACFTAPSTWEQFEENWQCITDPQLNSTRERELLARGAQLYEEETEFRQCVRAL